MQIELSEREAAFFRDILLQRIAILAPTIQGNKTRKEKRLLQGELALLCQLLEKLQRGTHKENE